MHHGLLDQFPPESPGPAPATVHETTAPSDQRPRARDISPEELEPSSIEAEAEDDATTRPKGPHWSVSFLIVGIVVIAVPIGIAAVMLTVALVFGLIWLSYTGLLVSVVRTQEAVIGLDPAPRLMIAAVWLLLTATAAAVLIRGRSLFLGIERNRWDSLRRVGPDSCGRLGSCCVCPDELGHRVAAELGSALAGAFNRSGAVHGCKRLEP